MFQLPADFGAYRLTGLLGEGGMARVYDGHRLGPRGFRKPVAIKVLRDKGPASREGLLREARLAASVRHPNVVDVMDVGEFEGTPYFVMERVDGQTLKQLLVGGALPLPDALDLLLQIAAGLAALHDAGIVHRDLKPANVLVDRAGRVRLVDLGISEPTGSRIRERWGTLNYMSPEQASGEFVSATADVFAFGALLVEVLTGERLWNLRSLLQVERVLADPSVRLEQVRAAVDAALAGAGEVLAVCLDGAPSRRHPDGASLWRALDALGETWGSKLAGRVESLPLVEPATLGRGPRVDGPAWAELRLALAVFRGGFTLEDAVDVLEGAGLVAPWLGISQLVDAGVVARRGDRLVLGGTETSLSPPREIRQAHAVHYARLGSDDRVAWLRGPRAAELKSRWLDEQHNLLAALEWALDHRHPCAWQLARALHHVVRLGAHVDGLDALSIGIDEPRTRLAQARAWTSTGRDAAAGSLLKTLLASRLDTVSEAQARIQLARVHLGEGDYAASQVQADLAMELADRHGLRGLLVRAVRVQAVLLRRASRYDDALRLLGWCARTCRALADDHYLARVQAVTGLIHMDRADLEAAHQSLGRAVLALRDSPDVLERATQLGNLALVQSRMGRPKDARAGLTEALALYEQAGRLIEAQHIFSTLAGTLDQLGLAEEAARAHERALELARGVRPGALPSALNDLACCRVHQGSYEEAEAMFAEAGRIAEQRGWSFFVDLVKLNRLEMMITRGDLDAADVLARELHSEHQRFDAGVYGVLELNMARLAARSGRPQQALVLLDRALDDLVGMETELTLLAQLERALVLIQLGRRDEVDTSRVDAWLNQNGVAAASVVARTRARVERILDEEETRVRWTEDRHAEALAALDPADWLSDD